MKRFASDGRILALILIAVGLMFAGCAAPSENGGSAESAAPADIQSSYGVVPISINGGNGALTIGSQADGLSDVTTVGGHNVEIVSGSTSIVGGKGTCSGIMGDVKCWIKLVNKDPSSGMYNVSLNADSAKNCINCGTAVFNNADNVNGDTTRAVGGGNIDTPILGSGFCYAEDGNFGGNKPYNAQGCSTYYTPSNSYKPIQTLHPACGQRSELLDFGNPADPTARYTFWASVSATYFPWNPVGADGVPNTADDDARYDFQNYTTVYMIIADLANVNPGSGRYLWGSWKRSNVLAGWGSPGNGSGTNLAAGTYFGVNVAVEAPDRVENYYMADVQHLTSNPRGYEYYFIHSIFFRYNPFVIERVRATHSGQPIKSGAQDLCATPALCQVLGYESNSHLEPVADGSNSFYGFGWVALYRWEQSDSFYYYAAYSSQDYNTDAGGVIHIAQSAKVCQECGQKGFAKMNRAFLGATIYSTNTSAAKPAFTRDGPDPAPENTIMVYHFFVKSNAAPGLSSELKVDTFATYTQFQWALHTSQTSLLPGGIFGGDWIDYCYPFYTGGGNVHYCQMPFVPANYVVGQRLEKMNPNILQSGESVTGGAGGIQAWNTYVCVQ
jgi:hypothetical protein